jgi:hypothetical protein
MSDDRVDTMQEIRAASIALLHWMESQDISPHASVPIVATSLASIVNSLAAMDGRPRDHVLNDAMRLLRQASDAMSES